MMKEFEKSYHVAADESGFPISTASLVVEQMPAKGYGRRSLVHRFYLRGFVNSATRSITRFNFIFISFVENNLLKISNFVEIYVMQLEMCWR